MIINYAIAQYTTDKPVKEDINKIRGYFGESFKDNLLVHNHFDENKFYYSYPLIQYKKLDDKITLVALEEGVDVLKDIHANLSQIKLVKTYEIVTRKLIEEEIIVKYTPKIQQYKIITPWIALNSENYNKYKKLTDNKEIKLFLNNILVGNILSLCKSLGIIVNRKLYVSSFLKPATVEYKGIRMMAFTGEFRVKYNLPDYIGLGKGVSHGFGTIKKIEYKGE